MIYSIGYHSTTLDKVVEIMREKGVDYLVDVRTHPYSRRPDKFEFNKNRLIEVFGARYRWEGEILGGKEGEVKPEGIDLLARMSTKPSEKILLIMCLEHKPEDCHRHYDISLKLLERGVDVIHIFEDREIPASNLKESLNGD